MIITLKDGSKKEYENEMSILEIAKDISGRLAKEAICAKVDGNLVDMSKIINENCELEIFTFNDEAGKDVFRHSSAHLLAHAVKRLYPDVKLAIGPSIEKGFYYDFDTDYKFSEEDFDKIKKEMSAIVKEDLKPERKVMSKQDALKYVKDNGEIYKIELIEGLDDSEEISFYIQGDFIDLCAGPHVPTTKMLKNFEILSVAGAYWKGDEKNKMLQRIYATSFPKLSMLEDYLEKLEQAKLRDHRKLGKEQGLFMFSEYGPGFPFFLPKGVELKNNLVNFWREVRKEGGYVEVETPIMLNQSLWEKSGHWYHYKENMYTSSIDDEMFAIKPMNCPGAMIAYNNDLHSYRELPLRYSELGRVHRHELSGTLHGLMRVRAFTQDDAHIFMEESQMKDELINVYNIVNKIYSTFGFNFKVLISTRPDDYLGEAKDWDVAEQTLKDAMDEIGQEYTINEGDGAFYGPKIDFIIVDSLDREWQCATVQLDFQLPERFDVSYIDRDGQKKRPRVIHTVALGSLERFIGIFIEHFGGAYPLWIAPVQVKLLPIADRHLEYAQEVKNNLEKAGIRVEVDSRLEKIGYKIREAQLQKVPYMFIIGDNEVEEKKISVRSRKEGEKGAMNLDDFIALALNEIDSKLL